MKKLLLALAFFAVPLHAASIASTPRGIVVAHEHAIELHANGRMVWRAEGVAHPHAIVVGHDRVAVLDPIANVAVIVDVTNGKAQRRRTPETPIAGAFLGGELYVLARDARILTNGTVEIPLSADPAFLREHGGRLYVYSRATGVIEEIDGRSVTRTVKLAPFASDFELDGRNGYLVYPAEGKIRTFAVETMQASGAVNVGAVPVDLAFTGGGTALTARTLAVADPSAKRVWLVEGVQSMAQAVARGFLRGLLGLGLYGGRASQFPTGVDRVAVRGKTWAAYDSSSRTLYRFTKAKSSVVAKDLDPHAFTVTDEGLVWWRDGRLYTAR